MEGQSLSEANKLMLVAEEKKSTEGASSTSSFPPIPTGRGSGRYDVFLSFNGLDTRKKFTDHLYHRLVATGICVFRDCNSISIGEEFSSVLLNAIRCSKISIPIISKSYASSKWCLRELIHIMDCKKGKSHTVLPIFYKVNPSDVRHLKGSFGEAFHLRKKSFDEKDIKEGQQALEDVSSLHGWKSNEFANGHEGELIERVVETVLSELRKDFPLLVPKELVGLKGHLKEIMDWINSPSANARMIGIYGMGGIGKTTLAKYIYNQLLNKFEHVSFLPDIRETTKRHNGITLLQSQLICNILQSKHEVFTDDEGINMIKSRFKGKKVLILLDDVDHKNQLNSLARDCNWFASGSIVIVTTRHRDVLDQSEFEVGFKCELTELDEEHSLILFSRHAFRMDHPPKGFVDISGRIISTMGGLPLALEVIGSYLYGKTNRRVWNDILQQLIKQPHADVQKTLKLSYDTLTEGQKKIFLDIACFFIGKKSKFAIYMWDDCGFYANQGIEELKLRCLIKVGDDGKFKMHDQLRDLGRSIVCQEKPLEECSRLWVSKEASKVLMEEKGTERIQAICLDHSNGPHQTYTNEQFKKLQRLRLLQLTNATLSGDFNNLFSELRWLRWHDMEPDLSFSSKKNLHLSNLVVLKLSSSWITENWRGWSSIMLAKRLKVLQLRHFFSLRCTPDLSDFTELEILIFKYCKELKLVHPSIGKIKSLVCLDFSGCCSLEELSGEVGELVELKELILDSSGITEIPTSIGFLRKLEKLSAHNCRSLTEIPSSIWDLENLRHLDISHSLIEKLPSATTWLEKPNLLVFTKIEFLNLSSCKRLEQVPPSIGKVKSLVRLDLSYCDSLKELPKEVGELEELKELILDRSGITKIPTSIGSLRKLDKLSARACQSLREIPSSIGDLQNLQHLDISECAISDLPESIRNLSSLQHLSLMGCYDFRSLIELPSSLTHLNLYGQSPKLPQLSYLIHLEELQISWTRST